MEDLKVYCDNMEAQLNEWDAKLENLKVKARLADTDLRMELGDEINFLATKKNAIVGQVGDLRSASANACVLIQTDMGKAMQDLESSFQSINAKLK